MPAMGACFLAHTQLQQFTHNHELLIGALVEGDDPANEGLGPLEIVNRCTRFPMILAYSCSHLPTTQKTGYNTSCRLLRSWRYGRRQGQPGPREGRQQYGDPRPSPASILRLGLLFKAGNSGGAVVRGANWFYKGPHLVVRGCRRLVMASRSRASASVERANIPRVRASTSAAGRDSPSAESSRKNIRAARIFCGWCAFGLAVALAPGVGCWPASKGMGAVAGTLTFRLAHLDFGQRKHLRLWLCQVNPSGVS